ncbi:uncharacterized protein METZ01_LOCUS330991 [marine metagenome]|uniref:Uncharacterized protein n=1 Tax=marine metagenome TaxID=408172 RepID=A0A382PZ51_9ZZZZ
MFLGDGHSQPMCLIDYQVLNLNFLVLLCLEDLVALQVFLGQNN